MNEQRKESVAHLRVADEDSGQRLDNFLLHACKGVPKSHVYRIIRSGQVRVNGGRVQVFHRLQEGDDVRVPPIRLPAKPDQQRTLEIAGKAHKVELEILYEDDAFLAINKPAGLAVHGGSGVDFGVIETLRIQRPEARLLELAHRLDRETSGVLLVAKKRSALRGLHSMFREGQADKRYLVLVAGTWGDELRDVRLPLHKFNTAEGERRVVVSVDGGQSAHTVFHRIASGKRFSLLEAQLKTGRTHQIRVHLSHLGYPIAGDEKYGDFTLNRTLPAQGLKRMFLHAWRIRFAHPLSGVPVTLEAGLPSDLARFLGALNEGGDLNAPPL